MCHIMTISLILRYISRNHLLGIATYVDCRHSLLGFISTRRLLGAMVGPGEHARLPSALRGIAPQGHSQRHRLRVL